MVARVHTIAFSGIEVLDIDLQVHIASGLPSFTIVGLPDKAVGESRERVRSALSAMGLALPPKRITINLAPADVLKEGSHFDLPVAVGLLIAMEILPQEEMSCYTILGELALDGRISGVSGVLPAAISANSYDRGLICPEEQGSEAALSGLDDILAPSSLISLINHFKGTQVLSKPQPLKTSNLKSSLDLADVKGQETARRALEITAAGGHNLLMIGPPGSGKSMLATRLPTILPKLTPKEALEVSVIHSVAGLLKDGKISQNRPFRAPHHTASTPALVGGGVKARPGEISLAHNGVLFLDELPEFSRSSLEALRQPLESKLVTVSRVNANVTYPARFQLIAAMNPCKCGQLGNPALECSRAPKCAAEYQNKISGPLLDRIDINIEVKAVNPLSISSSYQGESSSVVAERVNKAREIQKNRLAKMMVENVSYNAELSGTIIEEIAPLDAKGKKLLLDAMEKLYLSARSYHKILKVARTIADLENEKHVFPSHIAEAISYRHRLAGRENLCG
ncbi:MAG: YifB family Mg chelatase-like AAA ATPase [Alphaproteobacteria bacterium]